MTPYEQFLASKVPPAPVLGLPCTLDDVRTHLTDGRPLKEHQRACIAWAVRGGRRALFEKFGLGKSVQQLEILRIITARVCGLGLIVAPLGVRQEFRRDAALLGIDLAVVRDDADIDRARADGATQFLTHYEAVRLGKIDVNRFAAVSLDEAAVLRDFGSDTYQTFLPLFAKVPYRFVATAVPSPNRYKELIHYGAFLGIMDSGQALTRWFQRNSEKAGDLTLYPHKELEFWSWLHSWAVFLQHPSDLCGCSCHVESTFQGSGSGDLSSEPGTRLLSATAHGCATATAGEPTLQKGAICEGGGSSAAVASDRSTAEKAAAPIASGKECCGGAVTPTTRTGRTTEGAESPSVSDGGVLATSSQIWGNRQPEAQLSGSTTVSGTNPVTVGGQIVKTRPETQDDLLLSPSEGEHSPSPHGVKSLDSTITHATAGSSLAGPSIGHSPTQCAKYSCHEYHLPPLEVNWHAVQVDLTAGTTMDDRGQGQLLRDAALGVVDAAREKRHSLEARIAQAAALIAERPDEHVVVWHDLEDERRALEKAIPRIATLSGASPLETREATIVDFAEGRLARIGLKPSMFGAGTNIQPHCAWAIYVGVGHKFHDFIQSVHRLWRFGQTRPVRIDVIYAETEELVVRALRQKWKEHDRLTERMSEMIRERGLGSLDAPTITRAMGVTRQEAAGQNWTMINNDSVLEFATLPENSLDLIVTSIPFGTQYEYCASFHDFGHNDDNDAFWRQMGHLTPHLMRALKPGRMACIHVKDRIRFGNVTGEGVPTIEPFSDETVAHFRRHGWQYMSRITVTTDVVRENNQTYRLTYGEMLKDSTKMGAGMPEYVLIFRKPQTDQSRGYADQPVAHTDDEYSLARWQVVAHAFWPSSGDKILTADELAELPTAALPRAFGKATQACIYDHDAHVEIGERVAARDGNDPRGGLPKTFMALAPASNCPDVWTDITRMQTLNSEQSLDGREKHVCPLQIDIVDRLIWKFSMAGELVADPFAGIGTVPVRALRMGRRGWGCELHEQYYRDAIRYCTAAEAAMAIPTLFDLMCAPSAAAE